MALILWVRNDNTLKDVSEISCFPGIASVNSDVALPVWVCCLLCIVG